MKRIIQRQIPLNQQYTLIDKQYSPLLDGGGCTCYNCSKPIARIATIKNEDGQKFDIGFDCLDTILLNNQILQSKDLVEYKKVKKMIPKVLSFAKQVKETLDLNKGIITGINFESEVSYNWFTFYWLVGNQTKSNRNETKKIKELDLDFLVSTLKNIFPKLQFYINSK